MDKQYSVDFFSSFLENLQNLCQMYLSYDQFVEVSGYVSVEIDNIRKERYVLSEILQASGSSLSESYCTKVSRNPCSRRKCTTSNDRKPFQELQRNPSHAAKRQNQNNDNLSWTEVLEVDDSEPQVVAVELPEKVRKLNRTKRESFSDHSGHGREILTTDNMQSYKPRNGGQMKQVGNDSYSRRPSTSNSSSGIERRTSYDGIHLNQTSHHNKYEYYQTSRSSYSANQPRREQGERSWHVTKQEFPLDSISPSQQVNGQQPVTSSQHNQVDIRGDQSTAASNSFTESQNVNASRNSDPVSCSSLTSDVTDNSGGLPSDQTVFCKQEVDCEISEDALVYTDIDCNDGFDGSCSQINMESQQTYDNEPDESQDDIFIELSSDNEDLSMDDTEGVTDSSLPNSPKHDLSSYSKPLQFAVKRLINFFKLKKIPGPLLTLPPEQLDPILAEFYQRVRKTGGQNFGSRSLKTIQQYLEVYFRSNNYPASLTKSPQFQISRDVITAKVKQLKEHEESDLALKKEDIDHLYACGQLGDSSSESIINTLWLMNTIRLNIKGCKRHTELKWGDIMLQTDSNGMEVLIYGGTNLWGEVNKNNQDPARCFVNLYKKYWSLRPPDALDADSPFYLVPHKHGFKSAKYGGKIATLFKRMLTNGGLSQDMKILHVQIL